jgi:hypothetical protein
MYGTLSLYLTSNRKPITSMRKHIVLLLLFLQCGAGIVFGKQSYGFYYRGDTLNIGVNLDEYSDKNNCQFCCERVGDRVIKWTPYQVSQYGSEYGRIWFSRDIQMGDTLKKFFLERLHAGKVKLFYYKASGIESFYLERDNGILIPLPEKNDQGSSYREQLEVFTSDCPELNESIQYVSYTKNAMKVLFDRYDYCEVKPFPHRRFGFMVGTALTKMIPYDRYLVPDIRNADFRYEEGFTIGLFLDQPLFRTDFSLHTELNFSRVGFLLQMSQDSYDLDFLANIASFEIPLLLRYTCSFTGFRPYVEGGGTVTWNSLNDNEYSQTLYEGNRVEMSDVMTGDLIDSNYLGFSLGGGFEFPLKGRNSLFVECRWDQFQALIHHRTVDFSVFKLRTGINF